MYHVSSGNGSPAVCVTRVFTARTASGPVLSPVQGAGTVTDGHFGQDVAHVGGQSGGVLSGQSGGVLTEWAVGSGHTARWIGVNLERHQY